MRMAPANRPQIISPEKPVPAAILFLLFQRNELWHTVFIRRNDHKGPHGGQISLPGGMHEKYDLSLLDTAIRETTEELGIERNKIHPLGNLTTLYIPASNFLVYPFIGYYGATPVWKPNPSEVKYVIEARLDQLLDSKNVKVKTIASGNTIWNAPCYDIGGEDIWGATAMIVSEFVEILRSIHF